jgi:hypothetical protein
MHDNTHLMFHHLFIHYISSAYGRFRFPGRHTVTFLQHSVGVRLGCTTQHTISYGHCFDLSFFSNCIAWTARGCVPRCYVFAMGGGLENSADGLLKECALVYFTGWNHGFMRGDGRFQQYVDSALALMQDCNEATRITIAVAYVLL